MTIRRNLALALVGSFLLVSNGPAAALGGQEAQPWDTEIVWQDASHSQPLFLPQALISEADWSDPIVAVTDPRLHLTDLQATRLGDLLAGPTFRQTMEHLGQTPPANGCVPPMIPESSIYDPAPGSLTLPEVVKTYGLVFVGEVVDLVDGFKPDVLRPATRVVLKVSTVLRDPENAVRPDGTVSFIWEYGSVLFGSRKECQERQQVEGLYSPTVGDRVLFAGVGVDSSEYTQCHFLFQVAGDTLIPQPLLQLKPGPLPTLSKLEATARRPDAGHAE